jgi:TonB family protein
MKNQVDPDYPVPEQRAGVQGDVTVRVTVGVDGTPIKLVIDSSSQDDALDFEALNAVRKSTFSATTIDGKPTQHDYLLIYTFRVSEFSPLPVPKSTCSLTVDSMVLKNAGQPTGPDWYVINADANRSDIVSAEVTFLDAARNLTKLPWRSIALPPLGKDKTVRATGAIAWHGDEPLKFWVDSVKYADGKNERCAKYYELVDLPDAAGPQPRSYYSLTKIAGVISELTDPPAVAAYPTYPSAAWAADETGEVDIDTAVSNSGAVVGAFVVSSSNDADLDAAALAAALKNKYPAVKNAQSSPTRVFKIKYYFEDQPS